MLHLKKEIRWYKNMMLNLMKYEHRGFLNGIFITLHFKTSKCKIQDNSCILGSNKISELTLKKNTIKKIIKKYPSK